MPNVLTRNLKLILAASLIASLAVLAACGDDDDDDGDATPTPEASAEATATPVDEDSTPAPSREPVDTDAPMELREFTVAPSVTRANPGTVTFIVTNNGELQHEFLVIKSDTHIAELPVDGEDGVIEDEVDIVGRMEPLAPGGTGEVAVDVDEGKYVLICNLTGGGESHYLNGMYVQFTVEPLPGQPPVVTPVPVQ